MLPPNMIRQVIKYYTESEIFKIEIERALLEFFEIKKTSELSELAKDEFAEGLFNEWLVYDFHLLNNQTILEDFYTRNPLVLEVNGLQIYRDLAATNHYAMFEVLRVDLDRGLQLLDLQTGKIYDVVEKSATHTLEKHNLFFNRVAWVSGHWELVGANSPMLPIHVGQGLRKVFRKDKNKLTPKNVYNLLLSKPPHHSSRWHAEIDPTEAKERLKKLLDSCGLSKFVTLETVIRWIKINPSFNSGFETMSLLYGIGVDWMNKKEIEELLKAVMDVHNTTPKDALWGKSPQEMSSENPDRIPEIISDVQCLGGGKWLNKLGTANKLMQECEYSRAAKAFKEVFAALLSEKTTRADIYRLYANKAVCHFAAGDEEAGKKMIDLALDLNPNYDFGIQVKVRYEKGEYDPQLAKSRIINLVQQNRKMRELKFDPAISYYDYLRNLKINFATEKLTQSKLFTPGGNFNARRNDKCPCGSGKKYKRCHYVG